MGFSWNLSTGLSNKYHFNITEGLRKKKGRKKDKNYKQKEPGVNRELRVIIFHGEDH